MNDNILKLNILLDQNIEIGVKYELEKLGFLNISHVSQVLDKRSNDGEIFRYVKDNDLILITEDKKFNKFCKRYNLKCILINHRIDDFNTNVLWRSRSKSRIIVNLIHKYIKELIV